MGGDFVFVFRVTLLEEDSLQKASMSADGAVITRTQHGKAVRKDTKPAEYGMVIHLHLVLTFDPPYATEVICSDAI